jgi:hypothetical protein
LAGSSSYRVSESDRNAKRLRARDTVADDFDRDGLARLAPDHVKTFSRRGGGVTDGV